VGETVPVGVSALDGVVGLGRHGRPTEQPGVIASEVTGVGLALVTARRERRAALGEAVRMSFGVDVPSSPRRVTGSELSFIWCGPDQWLVYRHPEPVAGMEAHLRDPLGQWASIVDQSHARTLWHVTGPRVRDALAKGISIDLHPRGFGTGDVAITAVGHVGVHLWQIDDTPAYEMAVARSLTISFWHWLAASAAEYGLELRAEQPLSRS
jgi:methylglutamate dehydrogenase subunit D